MDTIIHEDKTFENIDYSGKHLLNREFLNCIFNSCDFTKTDFSNNDFMDCTFKNCNFSLTVFQDAGLKNSMFFDSKIIGVDFSKCNQFLFSVGFQNCHLDYSSFYQTKLKKTRFEGCSIKEADFGEADLSLAIFSNCDLMGSSFFRTNLEKTDFLTAINYAFDPEQNKIKKARFSMEGLVGLLAKYDILVE